MYVKHFLGTASNRFDDRHTIRDTWYKFTVHNVNMKLICACPVSKKIPARAEDYCRGLRRGPAVDMPPVNMPAAAAPAAPAPEPAMADDGLPF